MKTNLSPRVSAAARPADVSEYFNRSGSARAKAIPLILAAALALGSFALTAQEAPVAAASTNAEQAITTGSSANGLDLNFVNAPIQQVLNYLADSAGFIIQFDTTVRGTVNVRGKNLTREEVVQVLNAELSKNGYAAVPKGSRTLRVMEKEKAKTTAPVNTRGKPEDVPDNDEIATVIIPIRFVEAGQLISDLSPFVSSQATIIANQAANSIVITDSQSNIRHLMEIISAIDSSAEDVTVVKVFELKYADPNDMANLLSGMFPDQTSAQSPMRFAGNRGGRGGGRGGGAFGGGFNPFAALAGAAGGGNSQNDRIKKRNQVVAVADARTRSVVVTATRDLMENITEMVQQLDHEGMAAKVAVMRIENADPNEVLAVLQDTFGASSTRSTRNQNSQFQNRIQQYQNSSTSSSGFGGTSSGLGGGGGGRGNTGR